jgi:antitoxin ParD1/3/4
VPWKFRSESGGKAYVKRLVNEGRFASERDVICMGLRLLEEQGRKLKILRDEINAAIEEGGSHTAEGIDATLDARMREWKPK